MKIKIDSNYYVNTYYIIINNKNCIYIKLFRFKKNKYLISDVLNENSTEEEFIEWGKNAIERYKNLPTEYYFED